MEVVDGVIQEQGLTASEADDVEIAADAGLQGNLSSEAPTADSGHAESDIRPADGRGSGEPRSEKSPAAHKSKEDIRKTVAGGLEALGKIADMLRTPESTQALVDAIVKEDPDTGHTSLNIPVSDKTTVVNLLSAFSAFLNR